VRISLTFSIFGLVFTSNAQSLWSLQTLQQVTQSSGVLSTALSATGDVYISGPSSAFDWPKPSHTIGDTSGLAWYVARLDRSGAPIYTTVIGGAGGARLALDTAGNLYVYGGAEAKTFAVTPGAFDGSPYGSGGDFVCKLRASDGSVLFCSLPGTDGGESGGFTADSLGNSYFAEVPINRYPDPTPDALAIGKRAVQVTKLDANGAIVYRAEFSGPLGAGYPSSIAADDMGNVWVAGRGGTDFPTTADALLKTAPPGAGGFLAKLSASGTTLLYSTFTKGQGYATQIDLDRAGNIYVSDSVPSSSAVLRKYSPGGTALLYERTFSNLTSAPVTFAMDDSGVITALGRTTSVDFPTYKPVDVCSSGKFGDDWVMFRVNSAGDLIESTFLSIAIPNAMLSSIGPNGFLIWSTPTSNQAVGPYQLSLG